MNNNELKLNYPFGDDTPAYAQVKEIDSGIKWIRHPLPFALNHVNCWLLRDEIDGQAGWTLIDCGTNTEEIRAAWEQIFEEHLEGLPILRVLVTHMHPDHVGLAGWLCERWSAPLLMSMTDFFVASLWATQKDKGSGVGGDGAVEHFRRHGLTDKSALKKISERSSYYADFVCPLPSSFSRLIEGNTLKINQDKWHLISGYGHAPEHIALYCAERDILIAGDMLLPRISTNISVFAFEPEANPLPLFLNSIKKFLDLPDRTLVLPSHGKPFQGISERVQQLYSHHRDRLEDVLAYCKKPQTAASVMTHMFKRELDMHQVTFAMGEALAHLHTLYFEHKLSRHVNDDGIYEFKAIAAAR